MNEWTYDGVKITLTPNGRFQAIIQGKKYESASLNSLQAKIRATGIRDMKGKVALIRRPYFSTYVSVSGYEVVEVLGVGGKKARGGRISKAFLTGSTYTDLPATNTTFVKPNPAAWDKLVAIQDKIRDLGKEARDIVDNEFESITVEQVEKMIEDSAEIA